MGSVDSRGLRYQDSDCYNRVTIRTRVCHIGDDIVTARCRDCELCSIKEVVFMLAAAG